MDAAIPTVPPRRWFSLLTGRWHASSRVVTLLGLLLLIVCNLPGQYVKEIRYRVGHPFWVESQFQHGWPLTYLVRTVENEDAEKLMAAGYTVVYFPAPAPKTIHTCFELWRDCEGFYLWSLLTNGCVVLLVSFAAGVAFEAWRRQRNCLWHLHLRDFFAFTMVVALVTAWYARQIQRHTIEEAILTGDSNPSIQSYQAGGITWLRLCWGDESFQFLDRPFEVAVTEEGVDWSQLAKLTTVRHVDASVRGTTEDLAHLAKMPRLEALSLDQELLGAPPDNVAAELPRLPKLRGLYLTQPANRCRRIDRLTSLEALRVGEGSVDEQLLREISVLPNLRELALDGLPASADLSFLSSRRRLSGLNFYNGEITSATLKSIGQCPGLKDLSFYMCRVDGSGIRQLSSLTNLEKLNLEYTDVTSADLAPLETLKRLRVLELTETEVGGDMHFLSALENLETLKLYNTKVKGEDLASLVGLTHLCSLDLGYTHVGEIGAAYLRQMKQLTWLRVSNFDEDELEALRSALPDCEVQRH